ncbi:hypothetical protein N7466_011177 [Penicillium verhagenii]|uniref:uncharacterized protein n=1 Tax=Penicillium verhagenii TaxID=1562060 RepID=UPI00254523DD|nr:uncharacterized protein N7466_011177 [Penicillium verhagenii]KAJ5917623.1 hypothetical protein N7466_011177 [Penicillium verhagenii]
MATPSDIIISGSSFAGKWVIDKRLSAPPDPVWKAQGIKWVLRKAVALAEVTMHISVSSSPDSLSSNVAAAAESQLIPHEKLHLSILQIPTGGLAQIPEQRALDWNEQVHLKDFLFGARQCRSRLVAGTVGPAGRIVPDFDPGTAIDKEIIGQLLRGEVLPGGADGSGFLVEGDGEGGENAGLWIHTFDSREDGAWTMEQIWGFEMIDGERRHTRRFVVANKEGAVEMGRIVFTYLGSLE